MPRVKKTTNKEVKSSSEEKPSSVQKPSSEQKVQVKKVEQVKPTVEEVKSIVEDRLKELGALWVSSAVSCDYDKNMCFRIAILPNKRRKNPPAVIALVRASEKTGYISSVVPISPKAFGEIQKMYREAVVQYDKVLKSAEKKQKELEARKIISSLDKETLAILKQLLSQI